jgi:hypothetical protein
MGHPNPLKLPLPLPLSLSLQPLPLPLPPPPPPPPPPVAHCQKRTTATPLELARHECSTVVSATAASADRLRRCCQFRSWCAVAALALALELELELARTRANNRLTLHLTHFSEHEIEQCDCRRHLSQRCSCRSCC